MLNYTQTCNLTESQFLSHEIEVWGYEKVEDLLNSGFEPKLTNKGWTWIMPITSKSKTLVVSPLARI